jgi:hypothetical protein
MPVTPDDQEYSTTTRPVVRASTTQSGAMRPPASQIIRSTIPGSSAGADKVLTPKTTTPKEKVASYLPYLAGAALLFLFLRRRK